MEISDVLQNRMDEHQASVLRHQFKAHEVLKMIAEYASSFGRATGLCVSMNELDIMPPGSQFSATRSSLNLADTGEIMGTRAAD